MNFQHEDDARIYREHQRSGTTGFQGAVICLYAFVIGAMILCAFIAGAVILAVMLAACN